MLGHESEFTQNQSERLNLTLNLSLNRVWSKQKENTRLVFVKRAQLYHSSRIYMHALYRRRSSIDDLLLRDLVELCLSPYTRVRRCVFETWHTNYSHLIPL